MRNSKGFTLVELAVVLVIIGIILGAVIKGQDLITNAQSKQVASAVSSWRNLSYAYLDRNGRYPGDASRNGVIGDSTTSTPSEQSDTGSATAEIVNTMNYAPANPVTVGGLSFWVYFGTATSGAPAATRNAIIMCKTANCAAATTFSADELEIIKSLDASYDGVADAGLGTFRAATAVAVSTLTAQNSRDNGVVTSATAAGTPAGTATAWATTHFAAAWLFDRTFQ